MAAESEHAKPNHPRAVLAGRGDGREGGRTGEVAMPKNARNWAWFAGRPIAGRHALDVAQCAAWVRQDLQANKIVLDAKVNFGLASLLGDVATGQIDGGEIELPVASFRAILQERGDDALAEIPGLFELLDIPQLTTRWPAGQVTVRGGQLPTKPLEVPD